MAKSAYVGVDGIARKIKKMYVGVDSKARKVKKGYIGVGGVARPFFSSESKLEYYGKITDFQNARAGAVAATVGDYALFGSGNAETSGLEVYNNSLVKTFVSNIFITVITTGMTATSLNDFVFFAGGTDKNLSFSSNVYALNSNLTRTILSLGASKSGLASTNIGVYALFVGGDDLDNDKSKVASAVAFDANLVKCTAPDLSVARADFAATTVGNNALFGGDNNYITAIDVYDANLVKGTAPDLSVARKDFAATTVGNNALFGGGQISTISVTANVEAYNENLVKSVAPDLSVARAGFAATIMGNFAIFGGGYYKKSTKNYPTNQVDVYDSNLVISETTNFSTARSHPAATAVGNYALFGGGYTDTSGSTRCTVVNAYTVI